VPHHQESVKAERSSDGNLACCCCEHTRQPAALSCVCQQENHVMV
jgi:hypothetical protein